MGTVPAVKICGLTRAADAAAAEAAGAEFLGVILASGPRLLTVAQAASVLGARRTGIRRVAVFGAQSPEEVAQVATRLALDVVQLHRPASSEEVAWLQAETGCVVWPVVRVAGPALPETAEPVARAAGWLVLDALVAGQEGGTGVALDWPALRAPVQQLRHAVAGVGLVLAGGLRPGNVARAAALLSPAVVDVSSGVETAPGVKDPAAVQAFVTAARSGIPGEVR